MSDSTGMILRARTVLPVSQPPIENGAVLISGNRIRAVGSWPDLQSATRRKFSTWAKSSCCPASSTPIAISITPTWPECCRRRKPLPTGFRSSWPPKSRGSYSDYAALLAATAPAHAVAHRHHDRGDIEAMPDLLPEVWDATPLRVFSFLEMTGIRARRDPEEILQEAVEKIDSLSHPRARASLSPHAPYSTLPELLRLSAARRPRTPLAALHPRRGIRAGI